MSVQAIIKEWNTLEEIYKMEYKTDFSLFNYETKRKLDLIVSKIEKEIENIHFSVVESYLVMYIEEYVQEEFKNSKINMIKNFLKEQKNAPVKSFKVFSEVQGIFLREENIKLGKYYFYRTDTISNHTSNQSFLNRIKQIYHPEEPENKLAPKTRSPKCLVMLEVLAKDYDSARKFAKDELEKLEGTFNLILNNSRYSVKVSNNYGKQSDSLYVLFESGECMSIDHDEKKYLNLLDLKTIIDFSESMRIEKVWEIISMDLDQQSLMEQRILNAIGWMNRGSKDININAAQVQYTMALEGLVILKQGHSIKKRFIERITLLLKKDEATRILYKETAKEVYEIRSKIVHGNHTSKIRSLDLIKAQNLLREVLFSILSKKDLASFNEYNFIDKIEN